MSAEHEAGRLPAGSGDDRPIVFDAPNAAVRAILTKQDAIINRLNLILAAIESATDGNSLYAALDTATIKAEIKKLRFTL